MALSKPDVVQMCILDGIKLWCENNIAVLHGADQDRAQKRKRVRPPKIGNGGKSKEEESCDDNGESAPTR